MSNGKANELLEKGVAAFLERQFAGAASVWEEALSFAREASSVALEADCLGRLAAALAAQDDVERAAELIERARDKVPADDPDVAEAVRLHEGHVEIALARRSAIHGDMEIAAARRGMAVRRLASSDFEQVSDVVRVALSLLDASFGIDRDKRDVLQIGPGTRWFRAPGGRAAVDLSRRHSLRLVLAELASHREIEPGVGLSAAHLFEVGWPGERIDDKSANNRVRVAIATLRKLGLRALLVGGRGGYRLSPTVAVERITSPNR
jgi:hypothetical protein